MRILILTLIVVLAAPFARVSADTLQFCYDPYPPYTLGSDGTPEGGTKVALLKAVVDRIDGLEVEVILMPWKRCQAQARAGTVDGILPLFPNPEREKYLAFSVAAFDEQSVLWHRADQFEDGFVWDGNFAALSDLRLGMLTGSYVDEAMEAAFEAKGGITRVRDAEALMALLVKGRVDLVATDAGVGLHILRSAGWDALAQRMIRPIVQRHSHFGLSKASGADRYLEAFDAALTELHAEGRVAQIFDGVEGS